MTQYARGTDVSVDRTRAELERLLTAHGATGFGYGWESGHHRVVFRVADRMIRLEVSEPGRAEFTRTPTGLSRSEAQITERVFAETRRRWRSLLLVTKARFVAIEDGVMTLEQAFMADVVLPDGQTVSEWLHPQLDTAYATAEMPALMPAASPRALEAGRA